MNLTDFLKQAGTKVASSIGSIFSGKETAQAQGSTMGDMMQAGYQSKNEYPDTTINNIKNTIKYMESRGEKAPYSFSQYSGDPDLGDALGAYQITEAKLDENAKRFLGKDVSREEFLKNPKLQDKFVESEIKYLLDNKFKTNSLFSAHRGGWSDMTTPATKARNQKYNQYMTEATQKYNELSQNQ